ncbi:TRAPP subunit [Saccharomycopsis crataegensis]|uniref:Trafficking protein particle complex subunit n=1 Tax=Saccharomycopsis crataegensis TaxID=43959 RepID=A0AAV5QH41_9ASCO|nr:TRAPP subunit [Saccharomycopsis crataegensis]
MIHSLYILNKAGGLVYQQDYSSTLNKLSINDYLVFAGTIHGVHAIASKLTPTQITCSNKNANTTGTPLLGSTVSTPKLGSSGANHITSPRMESQSTMMRDQDNADGLWHLINNFTNINNPSVNNADLLSSSSVSYNKLSSNFFYMKSNVTGLNIVETDFFNIFIFQTLTGIKFILITSPDIHKKEGASDGNNPEVSKQEETEKVNLSLNRDVNSRPDKDLSSSYEVAEELLRKIYILYGDYVMKNPFYSMDMPIKAELFDIKVRALIESF